MDLIYNMSYWIDLKYLKYLPLEQFTPKGEGKFNFRCNVCGDSKTQSHKKGAGFYFIIIHYL